MFTALTNIQLAMLILQNSSGPRDYTQHKQYPKYINKYTNTKPNLYNSKHRRKNHLIKQPGIDIQRKTY